MIVTCNLNLISSVEYHHINASVLGSKGSFIQNVNIRWAEKKLGTGKRGWQKTIKQRPGCKNGSCVNGLTYF